MADLPDDLTLPLSSGEPWWYWLGGRPSIDFVNTLRERWWRKVDTLVTPADLVLWLQRAELLGWESPAPGGVWSVAAGARRLPRRPRHRAPCRTACGAPRRTGARRLPRPE
jgi:hypothetical protein